MGQLGLVTEQIWARCSLLEARCLEKRNNSCGMMVEERFRPSLPVNENAKRHRPQGCSRGGVMEGTWYQGA